MRRKEERSKAGQTNNKAKQHTTPKAVKKNELPRVGLDMYNIMWKFNRFFFTSLSCKL